MSRRRQEKIRYCICNTTNSNGDMICCDRCDKWYHFDCLGIIKSQRPGEKDDWFCDDCLSKSRQCGNPDCVFEARKTSKYCSDKCGEEFNRFRYMKFFKPKWEKLKTNHSAIRVGRMSELEKLENERKDTIDLIGRLKGEKEELESIIKSIKDQARKLSDENQSSKDQDESESEMDEEEFISSDQSKTFCVICGVEQPADKAFKHWTMCHKKQEAYYNFSSDKPVKYSCETDKEPNLYCQRLDKKTKRYCLNIESACPQHSNWQSDPDEICGCPLNVMQKLALDGNNCTKLKKDCTLHYNWDRFRLASKDMERVQAFTRLDAIMDKIVKTQQSLNDTYGGVIGVMLHNTVDETPDDTEMIDV